MNALEIKGLSRSFKNFELKDVSFVLPEGCIMGMVGENGAGKSTTIKLILNMLKKDSGEIKLFGKDFDDSVKEDVGAVLDDLGLPDCLDIKKTEKVMKGIFKNWESDTYFDLCQRLRIPYDKTIKEFSKGNRAKLAIVIALSHRAKLLLLDEPFSALDYQTRLNVSEDIYTILRKKHKSAILVTHDIAEAISFCDRILVMTHRPGTVKEVVSIELSLKEKTPLKARSAKEFQDYFNRLWGDLND